MSASINPQQLAKYIAANWDGDIIPELEKYIAIPNLSPGFDKHVLTNGLQDQAVDLMVGWAKKQAQHVKGMTVEVVRAENRTPVIFMEIPSTSGPDAQTVLMYGHMDKQPPCTGWEDGLGPYTPVIREKDGARLLYGRGGADDGYAIYASVLSVRALQDHNIPHGRVVIIIEASEESGSPDLPHYIDLLAGRIGQPNLVVCLDSGTGNYDQTWVTVSLRGIVVLELHVSLISEGVHSGSGSGVVADSFRVARMLVSRLEDENTGRIVPKELYVDIPAERIEQTRKVANVLGHEVVSAYPLLNGVKPVVDDHGELLLNKAWRPQLTVVGQTGLPDAATAGNVLRKETSLKLSLRIPPGIEPQDAVQFVTDLLQRDPPYGAKVTIKGGHAGGGWNAPTNLPWLEDAIQGATKTYFEGKEALFWGEGGSIPFMGMLAKKFPKALFFITGLLGPHSNAHGPNEFLHIDYAKKLNCVVTSVLADHAKSQ